MAEKPTKPLLLHAGETALLRGHLQGIPLSALVDYCGDDTPDAVLQRCREKLTLKARRLGKGWGEPWFSTNAADRQRTLNRVNQLQATHDIEPDYSQPLSYWLPDALLENAHHLAQSTVADWVSLYQSKAGKSWWQGIDGLPPKKAKAIEGHLTVWFPGIVDSQPIIDSIPPEPAVMVYQTAVVPLAHFLLPHTLNGAMGVNRPPITPFIPVHDDYQAILYWLGLYPPGSHTRRTYQREVERLLLWVIIERGKPLSSLDVKDMGDYLQFLEYPSPRERWVAVPKPKGDPEASKQWRPVWKPFKGPLSLKSRRHTLTVLNNFFTFLVQNHYWLHNPLKSLPKMSGSEATGTLDVNKSFSAEEWQCLMQAVNHHLPGLTAEEKRKWLRTRLILQLGYVTGMRIHEMAKATVGDIETLHRHGHSQYWLGILGKGQKLRKVPVPPTLYQLIGETHGALASQTSGATTAHLPLIPPLRGLADSQLTPTAIHLIVKDAFETIAKTLPDHPELAAKLLKASVHWLRHTHGSVAVDSGIQLNIVRLNLGHSNLATTSQYVHTEDDVRHNAILEGFI